jgi:hypothetical protein
MEMPPVGVEDKRGIMQRAATASTFCARVTRSESSAAFETQRGDGAQSEYDQCVITEERRVLEAQEAQLPALEHKRLPARCRADPTS